MYQSDMEWTVTDTTVLTYNSHLLDVHYFRQVQYLLVFKLSCWCSWARVVASPLGSLLNLGTAEPLYNGHLNWGQKKVAGVKGWLL